jgi:predicted P-loop ATPase
MTVHQFSQPWRRRRKGGDGGGLILTAEGGVRACLANAMTLLSGELVPDISALASSNPWAGVLVYDQFANRPVKSRPPPWSPDAAEMAPWEPQDDLYTAEWLQRHGCMVNVKVAAQAVQAVAQRNGFHPVRDHLNGLSWDGIERLDHWLCDHLGAEDTDLMRAIGARWLISAVARVYEPGCKADCILILEGPQGALKSTAIRTLFHPWFTDEIAEIGSKDAGLQLSGIWVIELAELDSLARAEVAKIKAFISRRTDRFRPPYGERIKDFPRQCVFAGTTNQTSGYLRDETGGRRFWPVQIGTINIEGLERARAQLWAEAVARYVKGEPWWLDTHELTDAAAQQVAERYEGDAWDQPISDYVSGRDQVSIREILEFALKLPVDRWDKGQQTRIGKCLTSLRWKRVQKRDGSRRQWVYVSPPC